MIRISMITTVLATALSAAPALAQAPYELTVKASHVIRASRGTLVFDQNSVEYRTTDRDDARTWRYDEIKQMQILSARRVQIVTFEDQGLLKFGKDRTVDFQIVEGAVTPDLVSFLLARIDRPVVTAVMPRDNDGEPVARIPVKHEQRRGSNGVLVVFADHLAYLTEAPGASRYWRYRDVASVMRLDPYRVVVSAYEGGGGRMRPFVFDLKHEVPDDVYAAVWARINPPAPLAGAADVRVTGSASR